MRIVGLFFSSENYLKRDNIFPWNFAFPQGLESAAGNIAFTITQFIVLNISSTQRQVQIIFHTLLGSRLVLMSEKNVFSTSGK